MTDETPIHAPEVLQGKHISSKKRDIIHFSGDKPTAINLEHVTVMHVEGTKVYLEFYTQTRFVDFASEEAAQEAFRVLMNLWGGDVGE